MTTGYMKRSDVAPTMSKFAQENWRIIWSAPDMLSVVCQWDHLWIDAKLEKLFAIYKTTKFDLTDYTLQSLAGQLELHSQKCPASASYDIPDDDVAQILLADEPPDPKISPINEWWYHYGKLHRESGPAIANNRFAWYIHGVELALPDKRTITRDEFFLGLQNQPQLSQQYAELGIGLGYLDEKQALALQVFAP